MNYGKFLCLISIGSAALMSSVVASAQSAPPAPAAVSPATAPAVSPATSPAAPPAAQPNSAVAPTQPAAYPPAPRPAVPVYAQRAPTQPYAVFDPSTGQTMLMTPVIQQRMPPRELPYSENRPVPRGYAVEEYHPRGLIISGAVTLGALWALSFAAASSDNFTGDSGWLAVPVVGPFGWLATRDTPKCDSSYSYDNVCHDDESSKRTLVALDGMGQLAGAALLISGLAITRKHLVLVDPQAAIAVAPYASSRGSGLQLIGQF